MPFITEELWQNLHQHVDEPTPEPALIVAEFPRGASNYEDAAAERDVSLLIDLVRAVRNIRAEKKVEPGKFIETYVVAENDATRAMLATGTPYIEMLARARPLHVVASPSDAPREQVATAVLEGVTAVVPLAGLFDTAAERARLEKQIAEAQAEAGRIEAKLANEGFRAKAPEKIVAAEEERLAATRARVETLMSSLRELG
jgi:valyl-tRNA synthetase